MSITVADCLKLPALRDARLYGGARGVSRVVTRVSVLEYPDVAALSGDVLVGNEIIISALVQIRSDVEAQCRIVRHLHSMGAACLVVYYVGVYVPELDERLIAVANELEFPLAAMPFGRMDFRYCDAITDVMELLISRKNQERYYVSDMVNRISQLQPQYRTINAVLRLLSDQLCCTLLLSDRYLERKGAAAYPLSNQWDYQQLLEAMKSRKAQSAAPSREIIGGKSAVVWDLPVNSKMHRGFHLFVLDEQERLETDLLQQATEVIELFLNIWNKNTYYEGTDALIHAILNDRPDVMARLAAQMHIEIGSIHTMWVLQLTDGATGAALSSSQKLSCIMKLKMFLQEYHKLAIVDSYEQYIIGLTDERLFEEGEHDLAQTFVGRLTDDGLQAVGATFENIEDTAQARASFVIAHEGLAAARVIYPEQTVLTTSEIRFARGCREVLSQGEDVARGKLACLDRLYAQCDAPELLQTLCVYLLDAGGSTRRTGELLFLHKNSIQYRINKIRSILGCDLTQLPESFEIYQAAAVHRLLN